MLRIWHCAFLQYLHQIVGVEAPKEAPKAAAQEAPVAPKAEAPAAPKAEAPAPPKAEAPKEKPAPKAEPAPPAPQAPQAASAGGERRVRLQVYLSPPRGTQLITVILRSRSLVSELGLLID